MFTFHSYYYFEFSNISYGHSDECKSFVLGCDAVLSGAASLVSSKKPSKAILREEEINILKKKAAGFCKSW
jgi:hypothetical protein